ncbi:GNAT family N-acetyltransferase [Roseibium algae]|uniref:GNAT family N-acetyltransferase n=1 Tax=Roseibium algae TaxID=3123038 RepID=A0ABU8TMR1_9HYPH
MINSTFTPELPVELLTVSEARAGVSELGEVLRACVEDGAGVGFVLPFTQAAAEAFWASRLDGIERGERHLLVVRMEGRIVGTVMLELAQQDNGRHRAEVAKLLMHPTARRKGLARKLLGALDGLALSLSRTLLVLDTVTGDTAEGLYPQCGYIRVGVIPAYATSAHGSLDATTVFYKQL